MRAETKTNWEDLLSLRYAMDHSKVVWRLSANDLIAVKWMDKYYQKQID